MSGFAFKQFKVQQTNAAMKVSTDGVLLGAWANLAGVKRLFDVGCGTGLLSLMCKQRSPELLIEAIDIEDGAIADAAVNIQNSPWTDIKLHHGDVTQFEANSDFDMVICNPPYFNDSLKGPDKSRNTARHTDSLSFAALLRVFFAVTHHHARLAIILPCDEAGLFKSLAEQSGLYLARECLVASTEHKNATRSLMEFGYQSCEAELSAMCIRQNNIYSDAFVALCHPFYLKM